MQDALGAWGSAGLAAGGGGAFEVPLARGADGAPSTSGGGAAVQQQALQALGRLSAGAAAAGGRGGGFVYNVDGTAVEMQVDGDSGTPLGATVFASPFGYAPGNQDDRAAGSPSQHWHAHANGRGNHTASPSPRSAQAAAYAAVFEATQARDRAAADAAAASEQAELQAARLDELSAMCATAAKEKAALRQILGSKVKGMVADILQEAMRPAAAGGSPAQLVVGKLQALELLVSRVTDAMEAPR